MPPSLPRWIASVPVALLFNIVTLILSPALALLSMFTGPVLPYPLNYFHTYDDDLDGGQHQNDWDRSASGVALWWQRVCWIWRNPGQTFAARVLGIRDDGTIYDWFRDQPGDRYCIMHNAHGDDFFNYQKDAPLWGNRYCKIWLGWHYSPRGGYHMLKMNFNPFKTKGGK